MTTPPDVFGDPLFGSHVPWPDTGADRADEALVRSLRVKVAGELAQRERRRATNGDARLSDEDTRQLGDALIWNELQAHAKALLDQGRSPPSDRQDRAVHRAVYSLLFEFAGLQPHLDRSDVVNVHAEGGKPVWLELTDGTVVRGAPVAASGEELVEFVRELGRRIGLSERRFDPDHYWVNLQLPDGSRLFSIAWVTREPHVFVRRHHLIDVTVADLRRNGAMSEMVAEFLDAAVRARFDLVIAGGQGDGKTTLLRALAAAIQPAERIVTIESDFELGLDHLPARHHEVIALEAREANVEGVGRVSCAELVRRAMRMSARRIIVGEVLGDEVLPMLQAMNSGAKGSLCTVHADSSEDVFKRLALLGQEPPLRLEMHHTYALAASAIDFTVFVQRDRTGHRVVSSIREIRGYDNGMVVTNELFGADGDGRAVPTGVPVSEQRGPRLGEAGFDPRWLVRARGVR
jgi:Flp pilus assembly CpaF family ATPase